MNILKKIGSALAFPWKHNKVFSIVATSVLAILIAIAVVATQVPIVYLTLNTVLGDERRVLVSGDPSSAQYYTPDKGIDSKADALAYADSVNEELCEEGFVLLKNDDSLPLAAGAKVSVFGINSSDLVYGGSGSAAKDNSDGVDLYKSLENAGLSYSKKLKNFYDGKIAEGKGRPNNPAMGSIINGFATGELPLSEYSGGIKSYAEGFEDAALMVVSRIGGEGYDLPRTMLNTDKDGSVIPGASRDAHYLELDNNEKALLEELCSADSPFDNVILVLNTSTSMELGFLNDGTYGAKLKGALWVGLTGGTGMNALGKILTGEVNPSGRLVDTYAADFTKSPAWENFGTNVKTADDYGYDTYGNGNTYTVNGTPQESHFVEYEEGIYIGYRYYETRGFTDGEEWYKKNVVFPFGYGLSYTDFAWSIDEDSWKIGSETLYGGARLSAEDKEKEISVTVNVKNTGKVAGKDVVQLYCSAPYYEGEIEKSHVVLGAFAKTPLIEPGQTMPVTLTFALRDAASYDYNDDNGNGASVYEADEGEYTLYIGRNAHEAWAGENVLSVSYTLGEDFVYEADGTTGNSVENRFDDVSGHIAKYLSRSDWEGTWPTTPTAEDMAVTQEFMDSLSMENYISSEMGPDINKKWYKEHAPVPNRKQLNYNQTEVKLYDLIGAEYDDELWNELLDQLTVEEMRDLIGIGNFTTNYIKSIDKPKTIDPDGPAGFTQFMTLLDTTAVVYDTCFYCSETIIGATWNVELAQKMGNAIGNESLAGNERGDGRTYSGWYAPAVNIHRTPFSGRNWEYYSEDGLISGKMAANVIRGAMDKGVYCYVKHFAVNDQETNRDTGTGLLTWLSEQSMREIYLKPFELAVKEGGATAMMSSFNRIGTVWAGGSYELLTEILRDEWGFRGMVITDYGTSSYMMTDQMIRAGGDLALFQGRNPSVDGSLYTPSHRYAMRQAVKNILYTVVNSNAMNGMGEGIIYRYAMPYWLIAIIIVIVVVAAGLAVWGFFAIRKSLKKLKTADVGTVPNE